MSHMKHPKAHVVSSERNTDYPGFRIVTVECPLCPARHRHGTDDGKRGDLGHRVAHCATPHRDIQNFENRGYIVWDETPLNTWERTGGRNG